MASSLLALLPLAVAAVTPGMTPTSSLLALRGGAAPQLVTTVKTAPEAYHGFAAKGSANALTPPLKTLHQSIMGGCYVGMGGLLSLSVAGNVGALVEGNQGLQRFIFAALFPVNLLLILMSGGQLFTGNSAAVTAAVCEGHCTMSDLVRSWMISYFGNVVGCGGFALAVKYCGLLSYGTKDMAIATAVKKCSAAFGPTLVKAIMCNWLVCMAVFLAGASFDLAGKMVGIWFPISTFVAIGMEHSVANMFLLPLGLLAGADLSVADVILKNMVPVTIGNAIAGALIVGCGYSYAFGKLGQEK